MIDARLKPDAQEAITPGEAVAGMLLNGLGFANRPLSVTPQFFANKPLDLLFHEGVHAGMFNRFTLGRTLDEAHAYGCERWLSELALAVCAQEGIDSRFNHLDTTSVALSGEYVPESDEHAIRMTHGDSKDHRPDLQQAVLALMVSPDGGVPVVSKSGDGHAADTQMFRERAETLLATLKISPTPRSLVADSKLYHEDNAANLSQFGLITRIPNTLKLVAPVIQHALTWDTWQRLDETTGDHRIELCHDGMAQRWLVVSSQAAWERAEATVSNACQRASEAIDKQLLHLQATRFETPEAAQAELATLENAWTSHQMEAYRLVEHQHYAGQGRPTPATPIKSIDWQIQAQVRPEREKLEYHKPCTACFVVGTNIEAEPLSDADVMVAYKGQSQAEGGFRFLKNPLFCVSSLCVKQTVPHSRAADGDDLRAAGLFRDATPPAPPIGAPGRDDAEPDQPTDGAADLALAPPTA